jgi:FlaA1/EpsC-like NDP-sugar epimerase
MIRLFKHYVPYAVLLLGLVDAVLLIASAEIGWIVRARQIGMAVAPIHTRIAQLVTFALALQVSLVAVGAYGVASFLSLRFAAARLAVALSLGVIFLSLIFFLVPPLALWRSNLLYATVIATVLLVTVRALLGKTLGGETFKRRIIVLGAGRRAARIEVLAAQNEGY